MNDQVDEAFVGTLRDAWVETRMEKDKTLLTLATGGIGLIATLVTTVGPANWLELGLYTLAGASFAVAIVTAIRIFDANSRHLEEVLLKRKTDDDPKLLQLDRLLLWSFLGGVVLTGAIALTSGYSHIRKGQAVAQQKLNESLSGVGRLQNNAGGAEEQKSLSGVGRLGGGAGNQSGAGTASGASTGSPAGSGGTAQSGDKK